MLLKEKKGTSFPPKLKKDKLQDPKPNKNLSILLKNSKLKK